MKRHILALAGLLALAPAGLNCPARADGLLKKGDTAHPITFYADNNASPGTGLNGLTLTVRVQKNGAASVSGAGTVSQPDTTNMPGVYIYTPSAGDVDTYGDDVFAPTASGATVNLVRVQVVAFDPFDPAALGLTRLDAAVSTRSTYSGGDTSGTTTLLARIPGTVQPQTGDSYARLGAPAGLSVSADLATLQGTASATQTAVNGLPTAGANAAAVWGAGTRSLTDKAGFSLASAPPTTSQIAAAILATPANLLATNASGFVTATNGGGSSLTDASVIQDVQSGLWNAPGTFTQQTNVALAGAAGANSLYADVLALPSASAIATGLLDGANGVETGETMRQTLRLMRAVLAGNSSVSGATVTFRRKDGTTAALTISNDSLGNRSASTPGSL